MREVWTFKEVVEPKSGKVHRLYWYNGKACRRIVLDTPMARQLAGYVLIEKDLWSSGLWLAEIAKLRGADAAHDSKGSQRASDRGRYNLVKGLFVAALTFYGKAFSQCEGRRIKLERRQLSAGFHEAHDEAISFRNNFAAHSGAKLLEHSDVVLALPPRSKRTVEPRVYREMTQPDYAAAPKGEASFSEVVEHARSVALQKIAQLNDKVLRDDVLSKGYAYWDAK